MELCCREAKGGDDSSAAPAVPVFTRIARFIDQATQPAAAAAAAHTAGNSPTQRAVARPDDMETLGMSTAPAALGAGAAPGKQARRRVLVLVCASSPTTILRELVKRLTQGRILSDGHMHPVVAVPVYVQLAAPREDAPASPVALGRKKSMMFNMVRHQSSVALGREGSEAFARAASEVSVGAGSPRKEPRGSVAFAMQRSTSLLSLKAGLSSRAHSTVGFGETVRSAGEPSPTSPASPSRAAEDAAAVASPTLVKHFPALTDTQLSQLAANPRAVLLLDGAGEADPAALETLASLQLLGWQGPIIVAVKQSVAPDERPRDLATRIVAGAAADDEVLCLATALLSDDDMARAINAHCRVAQLLDGQSAFLRHVVRSLALGLTDLCRHPALLRQVLPAVCQLREAFDVALTATAVIDAVLWREYLAADTSCTAEAVLYACGLAARLLDEGNIECYNPGGAKYAHVLPIVFDAKTSVVSFTHPFFRSYFMALRAWAELILDGGAVADYLGAPAAPVQRVVSGALIAQSKALAKQRGGPGQAKLTALRAFGSFAAAGGGGDGDAHAQTSLRAVAKFKAGRVGFNPLAGDGDGALARTKAGGAATTVMGGEWLAMRNVASSPDLYLADMLSDRVAAHASFAAQLWEFIEASKGGAFPLLSANAATLLCRAGQSFSGRNLARALLANAHLAGVVCCAADCRLASFKFAAVGGGRLDHCDFQGADLKGVDFGAQKKMHREGRGVDCAVLCVAMAPDADHVVTGNERGMVELWDCERTTVLFSKRHSKDVAAAVSSVAFNPSGRLVCSSSAGRDAVIVVWDGRRLARLAQLRGHCHRVTAVDFASDGTVVSASFDWTVKLWSVAHIDDAVEAQLAQQGAARRGRASRSQSVMSVLSPAPSPSLGGAAAPRAATSMAWNQSNAFGSPDASVRRRSSGKPLAGTPQQLRATGSHFAPAAALTPQPKHVSRSAPARALRPVLDPVRAMSPERVLASPLPVLRSPPPAAFAGGAAQSLSFYGEMKRHTTFVTAVAVCQARRWCASLSMEGRVHVTQCDGPMTHVSDFAVPGTKGAGVIRFSRDGLRLAVPHNRGVSLHAPETGAVERTLTFAAAATDISTALAFTSDGALLAAAQENRIVVWDVASGGIFLEKRQHTARVSGLAFLPSDNKIFSSSWDGCICICVVESSKKPKREVTTVAAEGQQAANVYSSAKTLLLTRRHETADEEVRSAAVSRAHAEELAGGVRYKFMGVCEDAAVVVCSTTNGRVDAFAAASGASRGNCVFAMHDVTAMATSQHSDLFAVAGVQLLVGSSRRRFAPKRLRTTVDKSVMSASFVPRKADNHILHGLDDTVRLGGGGDDEEMEPVLLVTVSYDRAFRVYDVLQEVCVLSYTAESPQWVITPGQTSLLLVDGFLSAKQLTMHVLRPSVFPAAATHSASSQHLLNLLQLPPDMKLACQRRFVLACSAATGVPAATLVRYVLPFCRKNVLPNSVQDVGPIRVNSKEETVCAALARNDTVAVITTGRSVVVWDLTRKSQITSVDRHTSTIVDVRTIDHQGTGRGGGVSISHSYMVTTSLDGTAIVAGLLSGECLVTVRPAVSGVMSLHASLFVEHRLLTTGSDGVIRAYDLRGVPCDVGNVHPFSRMVGAEMADWLGERGLERVAPAVGTLLPGELLSMAPAASGEKLALEGASAADIAALQQHIDVVRNEAVQHKHVAALDDMTILRETFAGFANDKIVQWLEITGQRALALMAALTKLNGEELLSVAVPRLIDACNMDYDSLAQVLVEELAVVRSKGRDSFAERSFEEVTLWAKTKHPALQLVVWACEYSGAQLLDRTDFAFNSVMYCNACKTEVQEPASFCTTTGDDHSQLEPEWDGETRGRVAAVTSVVARNVEAMAARLRARVDTLPAAHLLNGLLWYPMQREAGYMAQAVFSVPELQHTANLVLVDATVTIALTERDASGMVAVVDGNGATFPALTGVTSAVGRYHASGLETHQPPRWVKTSAAYVLGAHRQPTHPLLPNVAAMGISGSALTVTAKRDDKADFADAAKHGLAPPKAAHFFAPVSQRATASHEHVVSTGDDDGHAPARREQPEAIQGIFDSSRPGKLVRASVLDHLAAAVKRKESHFALLFALDGAPDFLVTLWFKAASAPDVRYASEGWGLVQLDHPTDSGKVTWSLELFNNELIFKVGVEAKLSGHHK
jgi:WD40 repeat protein